MVYKGYIIISSNYQLPFSSHAYNSRGEEYPDWMDPETLELLIIQEHIYTHSRLYHINLHIDTLRRPSVSLHNSLFLQRMGKYIFIQL